jgi:formylglycine-generating enzyme required for sulfatase activity
MKRYALLMAANHFADPEINDLHFAEQDAHVLAGVLRESGGFEVVKTLAGPALRKDVALDTARDFARQLASDGGGLLKLFYAGHGYRHAGKDLFLCPEARLADLEEFDHALSTERLKSVTALPGVERLLVIDSCRTHLRAGRDAGPASFELGLRNLVSAADPQTRVGGWTLLAACAEGEQACELPELEHGAFCHAYLEALRQARAAGHEVRLDDAFMNAVRANLRAVLTRYRRTTPQNPWRLDAGHPPVILGGKPALPRHNATPAFSGAEPAPAPAAGGSVVLRLREEAQRRAAAVARRKAIFDELYPAYGELRRDRHTRPADLADAWSDLCRSCGIAVIPAAPGELEWHEDGVRVVARPTATAKKERPYENSLGMRFVPVVTGVDGKEGVLMSVWPTRVGDYGAYAVAKPGVDMGWKSPGFAQEESHPVVKVNWEDAKGFCEWLTEKERKEGRIGREQEYRLPTDEEWSWAVGIGEAEERAGKGRSPAEKDAEIGAGSHAWAYPWGKDWPPPKGAGNYDGSLKVDDYAYTSPVGSFATNPQGLHDLGGNVWDWCEDFYDGESDLRVLRGASWNINDPRSLLSSFRLISTPVYRINYCGFRVVLLSRSAC